MVVVRFSVFQEKVKKGTKKQTIREENAYRNLEIGKNIQCYSTKKKEGVRRPVLDKLLYESVITDIRIISWRVLRNSPVIAALDGFEGLEKFRKFFRDNYDPSDDTLFKIIRWK